MNVNYPNLFYFLINGIKLLTFNSNFFHLLRHAQKCLFHCKIQMKAIQKIVPVREVSTVTEFKLMFVLFCFSSYLLICTPRNVKCIKKKIKTSYYAGYRVLCNIKLYAKSVTKFQS